MRALTVDDGAFASKPDLRTTGDGPAHARIEQWLGALIADGSLTNGDRLPPEGELAAAVGVSRMTLRQALSQQVLIPQVAKQPLGKPGSGSVIQEQLKGFDVRSVLDAVYPLLSNASSVAGLLTTVVMAVFFIAMDSMGIDKRMLMLLDVKPSLSASLSDFASGVRRYWVVATIFGLIVAFLDVIALAIIDVPLIWVWGVLAFLTNYIPNIGFVIGLIPPALLALVDSGWQSALWVIIAYSVLNFVIQAIIQPKFTGESVGVTPLISFFSLLFWVWVLGWLGALLALPATLLLKALLVDADPRSKWVNILLASDPDTGRSASSPSPSAV